MVARTAFMMAGIPALNNSLYRQIRFMVGDPAVYAELPTDDGRTESTLILRDIEMDRARKHARVDHVACPSDFTPESGLSGDRETATAQAAAELFSRKGIKSVVVDRSLAAIYANQLQVAGIHVECDIEWGVLERRAKDEGRGGNDRNVVWF